MDHRVLIIFMTVVNANSNFPWKLLYILHFSIFQNTNFQNTSNTADPYSNYNNCIDFDPGRNFSLCNYIWHIRSHFTIEPVNSLCNSDLLNFPWQVHISQLKWWRRKNIKRSSLKPYPCWAVVSETCWLQCKNRL